MMTEWWDVYEFHSCGEYEQEEVKEERKEVEEDKFEPVVETVQEVEKPLTV